MTLIVKTWTEGADNATVNGTDTHIYKFLGGNDTLLVNGTGPSLYRMGDGNDAATLYGAGSTVYGDAGNDSIIANNKGKDFLYGGDGDDKIVSISYSQTTIADVIDAGAGDDTIEVGFGIGSLVHAGTGNDRILIAGGQDGQFFGEAGDDRFDLKSSYLDPIQKAIGGVGNDSYYLTAGRLINFSAAQIVENANEGNDTVHIRADVSFTLPENVENLIAVNDDAYAPYSGLNLFGNGLATYIVGSQWGRTSAAAPAAIILSD